MREPIWCVREVLSFKLEAWMLARESLRGALEGNDCVREALGAERGCWIVVGEAHFSGIWFWGIRPRWTDSGDEVMIHKGRVRSAARRQLTKTS
jgi:hypothetical protein